MPASNQTNTSGTAPTARAMVRVAQSAVSRAACRARAASYDREFPFNGCASLISALLITVGLHDFTPEPFVIDLANELLKRGWVAVSPTSSRSGDIAITANDKNTGRPAHTFLIMSRQDDTCVILDNQNPEPHSRTLSGADGKTPTAYVLRTLS